MPKLSQLDAFSVLVHLRACFNDSLKDLSAEFDGYDLDEMMVIVPLLAGELDTFAFYLEEGDPLSKKMRETLIAMIAGETNYKLVAKKNSKFKKNNQPEINKLLNKIARLRVGFAIEAFGGFKPNNHESAIARACNGFDVSRSFAEKVWSEYLDFDVVKRKKFQYAWLHMCEHYDKIDLVPFLEGKD